MTLFTQSSGTIVAILLTMAIVAWLETLLPLQTQTTRGLLWLPFRRGTHAEAPATTRPDGQAAVMVLLASLAAVPAWADEVPRGADEVNRGVRLARRGKAEQALEAFARAARRNPELAEAHLNRGLLLAQSGRHPEAQAALRRALTLDPDMPEALEGLGLSLLVEQRNRAAAAAFEQAIAAGASSPEARFNLALARARLGELPAAVQACQDALRIRPGMAKALALLRALER
jgi:tetratricopeptide (TPR) repeat protein